MNVTDVSFLLVTSAQREQCYQILSSVQASTDNDDDDSDDDVHMINTNTT